MNTKIPSIDLLHSIRHMVMLMERQVLTPLRKKFDLQRVDSRIILSLVFAEHLSKKELAENIGMDASAMSRSIDRLINRGYVKRVEDPKDRRAIKISLTNTGKKLHGQISEIIQQYWSNLCKGLESNTLEQQARFIKELTSRITPIEL